MTKQKLLIQMEHHITGVGILEIIKKIVGEDLDVSQVNTFNDAEKRLREEPFDMLVMDIKIIKSQLGKHRLDIFLQANKPVRILMICDLADIAFCRWLYFKGVLGVAHTNSKPAEIGQAIANVYHGKMYVDNKVLMRMIKLQQE